MEVFLVILYLSSFIKYGFSARNLTQHGLHCIPQILIGYISIICLKFSIVTLSLTNVLCTRMLFNLNISRHFPLCLSVIDLYKSIIVWENALYPVQFSHSVMSNSLQPHGLKHARLPRPSPTPGDCSDSCQSSQWCHPTISSSVVLVSCLQSLPASGSFPLGQFFASDGHILEFQLQHQSFQCIFRTYFL